MEERALIEQLLEMDISDYVENITGIKLTVYQKKILEIFADLKERG